MANDKRSKEPAEEPAEESSSDAGRDAGVKRDLSRKPDAVEEAVVLSDDVTPEAAQSDANQDAATADHDASEQSRELADNDSASPVDADKEDARIPVAATKSPVGFISGVVGAVIGAAAAIFGLPYIQPMMPERLQPSPSSEVTALQSRVTALHDKLGTLSTSSTSLGARLSTLDAKIADQAPRADHLAQTTQSRFRAAADERQALAKNQNDLVDQINAIAEEQRAELESFSIQLAALQQRVSGQAASAVETEGLTETRKTSAPVVESKSAVAAASRASHPLVDEHIAPLQDVIAVLKKQVGANESVIRDLQNAQSSQSDAALKLEERLDVIEASKQARADGDAALGVAFASLAQAVAGASPYETEIATLEKIAGISADDALKSPADKGLTSKVALAAQFDRASRDALAAAARAQAEAADGFWDGLTGRLSQIVVVRQTAETEGDTPSAILSRAEARVDEGAIAAALSEIDALPPIAFDAMGAWIDNARERAQAEAALASLRAQLLGAQ
jgi:hypothetical protein